MNKTRIYELSTLSETDRLRIAQALDRGALAVFATDTVYGLGTGACCEPSVLQIYQLKQRPTAQPLQLLISSLQQAQEVVQFTSGALRLAQTYWPGGLTLILPPTQAGKVLLRGAAGLGLRVPAHRGLQQILSHMKMPLACTSANLHGKPVLTSPQAVQETFAGRVDLMLLDGQLSPTASSVVDFTTDPARVLREGSISKIDLAQTARAMLR